MVDSYHISMRLTTFTSSFRMKRGHPPGHAVLAAECNPVLFAHGDGQGGDAMIPAPGKPVPAIPEGHPATRIMADQGTLRHPDRMSLTYPFTFSPREAPSFRTGRDSGPR